MSDQGLVLVRKMGQLFDSRLTPQRVGVPQAQGRSRHTFFEHFVERWHFTGRLRPELAAEWGLSAEVIVSAGGGDNMMGAIGTGNIKPGVITASFIRSRRLVPPARYCTAARSWASGSASQARESASSGPAAVSMAKGRTQRP